MSGAKQDKPIDWLARLGKDSKIPFGIMDMLIASLFINVLSLVMPLSLLQIYDRILPNSSFNTLTLLVTGIGVALLFEAFLRIGRSYLSGWIGARFEHMAGCASIERILSTSVNDFEKDGSGVHLERLGSLSTLKEFYAGQAILTLFDLPFAFIFLVAISYLAGNLVFVPIVLIFFFALSAWRIGIKLRAALAERMIADERRFNFIIEVLGGIHTLKSMAMETQMLRRYERLQEACARSDYAVTGHSSAAMNLGSLYSQLTMFAVVGFGSTFVIDAQLTVGGLAACTMLSGRSMQPLQRAVGIWARFQSIELARGKLREVFELQPETKGGLPVVANNYSGAIELRDVALRFTEDGPPLFSNVNLKVEPGQIIGISGGNASGKSSLLYLMMGAMRTSHGQVLIDGQNINELDPNSVRRKIAYLPQHGVLFNGSILENLTMFKPELEEKALKIARLLGLDDVVARMPIGYDTNVGNGAFDSLPRGIKQRIAIGRALMSDPVVLLFDEANSSMDSAGDKVLTQFLEDARGKRTLILVTHRPSLLRMADQVFDLTDGKFSKRDMSNSYAPAPVAPLKQAPESPRAPQGPQAPQAPGSPQGPVITQNQPAKPNVIPDAQKPNSPKVEEKHEIKELKSKVQVLPPVDGKMPAPSDPPKFILKKRSDDEKDKDKDKVSSSKVEEEKPNV
jgi:ATP-binding cassette, subfamily C, bacterial LapB